MASDFRFNPQTGHHEVTRDGVYERQATDAANRDRVQLRKGHALSEADAQTFHRVGPWPGETDENEVEAQVTSGAKKADSPENKAAQAPENKSR